MQGVLAALGLSARPHLVELQLAHDLLELAVHLAPFADAQEREKAVLADAPQVGRALPLRLLGEVPQAEEAHEVGALVAEAAMEIVGLLLELARALARVLDVERRGDDQDVAQDSELGAGHDHARDPGIDGESCETLAERRQLAALPERPQLLEDAIALGDGLRLRRIEEGKVLHVAEAERLHAQDDGSEASTLDLGIGERGARGEALLVVEPHADAVADASAATLPLIGAGLGDGLDLQSCGAGARVVAREARDAGVDHVDDPGDGHRRLRDVGGEDDAPLRDAREHLGLIGGGEARVERLDHRVAESARDELVLGLADLALARQEHEDVAVRIERRDVGDGVRHRLGEIGVVPRRLVEHVDRIRAPLDLDDRGAAEELGEALGVDGGRADDHLEVGPLGKDALQPAQEKIDGERALVRLVDDERVVAAEQPVAVDLGEEDAVGHELHVRRGGRAVVEADLVPDVGAERRAELAGDAGGDAGGRDPPRLGHADDLLEPAAHREGDLRELRGLARAGSPRHDDHLVAVDGGGDVRDARRDRQLRREAQG